MGGGCESGTLGPFGPIISSDFQFEQTTPEWKEQFEEVTEGWLLARLCWNFFLKHPSL